MTKHTSICSNSKRQLRCAMACERIMHDAGFSV
jgi:hypothetical protein